MSTKGTPPRWQRVALLACCGVFAGLFSVGGSALAQVPTVAITEVHYHPGDDVRDGEFVELVNYGAEPVELTGWFLVGGIQALLPNGAEIAPQSYVVIAADRAGLMARYPDLDADDIIAEFEGSLSNGGERLQLWTSSGYIASFVEYGDGDPWPETPDGLGPSLERISPYREENDPEAWAASIVVGGSPAAENTVHRVDRIVPVGDRVDWIVPGDEWRFVPGQTEPPVDWTELGFDDNDWGLGASGFGYGDDDDATVFDDMFESYVSVYVRRRFTVEELDRVERLVLAVDYDDGFVAYLNGVEIARSNVEGTTFDSTTPNDHEAGLAEEFLIAEPQTALRAGDNVLAIQVQNRAPDSSDLSLIPALFAFIAPDEPPPPPPPVLARPPRDLVINEVVPGAAGWVELYNPTDDALDIGERQLGLFPSAAGTYSIPAGTSIPARGFLVIEAVELGFALDTVHAMILSTSDDRFVDGFNPRTVVDGRSSGRHPDGATNRAVFSDPSRDETNSLELQSAVVINEIMYHPADDNSGGEYVEFFNSSAVPVDVSGWAITRGVSFVFPAATTIGPGAYLVVARDPDALEKQYGIVGVLGPFEGGLRNDAETILVRDADNNVADRVRYADEGSWAEEPDGLGPSLELIHENLDNRYGRAWGASVLPGTPGLPNTLRAADALPVIAGVEHRPVLPTSSEAVRVLASVSDDRGIDAVSLFHFVDNTPGDPVEVAMVDDGVADDGIADNGIFGADIPPRDDDAVVAYWIRATARGDQVVSEPPAEADAPYLYIVEDDVSEDDVSGLPRPLYRLVMRARDLDALRTRGNNEDDLLNVTVIANGRAYHRRGIRYRGSSARSCDPLSYRVQFDHDIDLHGIKRLNLNGCNADRQWIGLDLLRRSDIATPASWFRKLSFNGRLDPGWHLRVEAIDGQYLERLFPDDDDGNLYRGERQANLDYRGEDPNDYRGDYNKVTNELEDDFSDVIDLSFRLDEATTPDDTYVESVLERVATTQWAFYFAAYAVLGSTENSIVLNNGDDYFLYHRFSDDLWVLLPWDLDSCFDEADQRLFRPTVDSIERFLTHPAFAPSYWCGLEFLMETSFDESLINSRIDHLGAMFGSLPEFRRFATDRRAYIEERLTAELTVTDVVGGSICGGVVFPGANTVTLRGTARGCGTAFVEVDGVLADYEPNTARWSAVVDVESETTIQLTALDHAGNTTALVSLLVEDVSVSPGADAIVQLPGADYVAVDAIDADLITDPNANGEVWDPNLNVDGAIGRTVLTAPLAFQESPDQSHAIFRFRFSTPGTYLGYYRTRGFNRFSDTFYRPLGFDANPSERTQTSRNSNFVWVQEGSFTVTQADVDDGRIREVRVGVRESFLEFDALVLHQSGGLGNAELAALVGPRTTTPRSSIDASPSGIVPLVGGRAEVTLDGSASHDGQCGTDGLTYAWRKISGPDGDRFLGDVSGVSVAVEVTAAGTYTYALMLTDTRTGGTDDGEVTFEVRESGGEDASFLRCDANSDGLVNLTDGIFALNFLFLSGTEPRCREALNCNSDEFENLTDAIFSFNFLFLGGPPPSAPYPECDTAPPARCGEDVCDG